MSESTVKQWDIADFNAIIEARRRREKWYKPGVWMLKAAKRKAKDARREVQWAKQRVFRGWDDRAVWAVDDHLAKTLGEQLVTLARINHGYPDGWDPQVWEDETRKAGEALLAYQKGHYDAYGDDFDAIYKPAQEALVWVSENLCSLWD